MVCYDVPAMKRSSVFKCISAAALLSFLAAGTCFAGTLPTQTGFPVSVNIGMETYDKLCYAGHVTGGGMFYDDGYMITPDAAFTILPRFGGDSEVLGNLSMEIDLIYENTGNTGCVRETIRKYDFGDVRSFREYTILSETALKSLKQRKKLYSSDVMSIKMVLSYKTEGGSQKKQAYLLYLAKDDEYREKRNVLSAPPSAE